MRKSETKLLESTEYRVTQFGALEGRKVLLRLIKSIGPVLMPAAGAKDLAAALPGIGTALEALKEEDIEYLCDVFARHTEVRVNGKWPQLSDIFDLHFGGKYLEMFLWLKFCVEVNFSDFFRKAIERKEALSTAADPAESA